MTTSGDESLIFCWPFALAGPVGCRREPPPKGTPTPSSAAWQEGDVVAVTGVIWPSQLRNVIPASHVLGRYFIKGDAGEFAFLKSADIDKLAEATKLSVKGKVQYVQYDDFPHVHCYIVVSQFTMHHDAVDSIKASFKRNASAGNRLEEGAFLINLLKPGMTRAQVREVLGNPAAEHSTDSRWSYTTFFGRSITVQFKGHEVVSIAGG